MEPMVYATAWALLPPVIAIVLALITKEVYSSLFIGIIAGALLAGNFSPTASLDILIGDGLIEAVKGTAGVFIFLVELGVMVALVNRSGASGAFGNYARSHIKKKSGALLATFFFGILIFIDDYFNCLTVGAVMAPVTDSKKISRAKLAYLIDATAAPICMIAPISSWAAAVSSSVDSTQYSGIELFVRAIPFNFYSLLTLVFVIAISKMGFDYGKMRQCEALADAGDPGIDESQSVPETGSIRGRIIDMVLPILVLVVVCVVALIYNGGFFSADSEYYMDFVGAFGETDATVGLPWGGLIALLFTIIYYALRKIVNFKESMAELPKGFTAMVPAILILTFATALKNTTGLLGADVFVKGLMAGAAAGLTKLLPAVIFVVAIFLAFSTGTSWGTFGILIPIVTNIFPEGDPLLFVGVSACLAGAVCGDHCSPISDTTIMSSAGARCNHVLHVQTQIPYALTVAILSFIGFIIAGLFPNAFVVLPIMAGLTVGLLFLIRYAVRHA